MADEQASEPTVQHGNSTYSEERAEAICELVATSDKGVQRLHEEHPEVMPHSKTLWRWLNEHSDFAAMYGRAREAQAEYVVDRGTEIIDEADPTGPQGVGSAHVAKAKEQAQHRRWIAARLAPRKWGDRVEHDLGDRAASTLSDLIKRAGSE